MKLLVAFSFWLFSAVPTFAQLKAGDAAPDFTAEFLGADARGLGDFRGQVVFVDFWRTWCVPCKKSVPHLNELHETYKELGLVVIGVTNEEKALVVDSIAKTKSEFPIALVKGDATDAAYGVSAFPHSLLIDASGRVVWQGLPNQFDPKKLDALLAKVTVVPLLPSTYKDINKWIERRELGKAKESLALALATAPEDAELLRAKGHVDAALTKRMDAARAAAEAKDFGRATDLYREVVELFAGQEVLNDARRAITEIERNPAAKSELSAHAQVKKGEDLMEKRQASQAAATWRTVVEKSADTFAAKRATVLLRKYGLN